jgi:hypothetical protein
VTLTSPSGVARTLKLAPTEPGVWETSVAANELGLWRATDGKLTALVNIGPVNPREFAEVTSTTEVLAPITNATGGDSRRLDEGSGVSVPRILAVRSGDTYKGDDWIGLKMRDARVVRGIGVLPVFAGFLGLLLLLGSLAGTWAREGRLLFRADRSRYSVKGAVTELGDQEPLRIDRTGHDDTARRNAFETALSIIRLVADQDHQPMAFAAGLFERAGDQSLTDAAIAKRRLDRERSEQQHLRLANADRRQPHRADQQRADTRGERQIEAVRRLFAQAVRGLGVAARTKCALVQALDRRRVALRLRQDGQGNIGHGAAA